MDSLIVNKIDAYIKANRDSIIRDLTGLVRTPSVTGEPSDGAPYGADCRNMLDVVCTLFKENGFDAEVCPGDRYALSYFGEGEKTIALFSHSDVVPVADDWIFTTPFDPIEKDGFLIGRGIEDNKAGITICLHLMKMLRELEIPMKNRVMTFVGSCEETGMEDIKYFAREQKMPELCFVPDNAFPVTVGEKTLLRFFAKSVTPFRQIVSVSGGDRFNVVLGEAVCKIKRTAGLESELKEKTADKDEYSINSDGDCITLTARGLSSHAAMPEGSVCAAKLMADLLAECSTLDETDRKIMKSAAYLLSDPYATALNAAHEDSRFGKTTASTGIFTTEDGMLKFSYDMRYAPDAYGPDILTKLENRLASYGFSLIEPELDEGFDLGDDTPLSRKITEIYSSVFPGENSCPARSGGGTYARYLKNAYSIGVCAPHTTPELEMPAGHGGAHQPDEKIAIEGFFAALKVITMMVIGCDEIL